MTSNSPSDSSSIFEDGKLKSGIHKIQNLYSRTYLDINEHSRQLCCRPVHNLEEGSGLVRPFSWFMIYISDDQKWKITPLGAGYSVQRVSANVVNLVCCCISNDVGHRLNQGNQSSFAHRWVDWMMSVYFPSPLIPWRGGWKSSTSAFEYIRYEPGVAHCTGSARPRYISAFTGESRRELGILLWGSKRMALRSNVRTFSVPENTFKLSRHLGANLDGHRTLTLADLEVNPREDWG